MHRLQDKVLAPIDLGTSLLRWRSPCKEDHAIPSLLSDNIDDSLRQNLPSFL